MEFRQVKIGVI